MKVLIADKMDPQAAAIFERRGIAYDIKTGLDEAGLVAIANDYDGIAARSSARITAPVIKAARNLKVIGRAGIGVDTIDVPAATAAGVVVMNTPFGNSITTAEHAIAMMFALARQIPQANASTHAGKWEKSKFMGVELYGKVLAVIGCGNIGSIVANRALGLQMRVLAYDPFLTDERAQELGVEKVDLETALKQADFITLHVPKTESTSNMIDAKAIATMKKGVRIINCARGGLIVETDLLDALNSGHVAGAALDVFTVEPATENPLFGHPNVVCTPHLGASTNEAQLNVAIQVAEQMADFLLLGAVSNAVNMPAITAEEAPRLRPYLALAEKLGLLLGQIVEGDIDTLQIEFMGGAAEVSARPLVNMALASYLRPQTDGVNMVNAREYAKARDLKVSETVTADPRDNQAAIRMTASGKNGATEVSGNLFGGQPRLVTLQGVPVEAALEGDMLYLRNQDKPGTVGGVGSILGEARVNIADFRLGRTPDMKEAVCLVNTDSAVSDDVLAQIKKLPQVLNLRRLRFA